MTKRTLRVLRAEAGIASKEAARRVGVHPVTYSDYENGRMMPSGATLQKIAEVFDCSADEIELESTKSPRRDGVSAPGAA